MRTMVVFAGLLFPSMALALDQPVEGLTRDGSAFLYGVTLETENPEPEGGNLCTASLQVVRDVPSGAETRYLLSADGENCGEIRSNGSILHGGFGKFLKAHPLSPLAGSKGPKGARLVGLRPFCAAFTCSNEPTCVVQMEPEAPGCPQDREGEYVEYHDGTVDLAFKTKNGRVYPVRTASARRGQMAWSTHEEVRAFWLGDDRAALLSHSITTSMRSHEEHWHVDLVTFDNRVRVSVLGYADPKRTGKSGVSVADEVAATVRQTGNFMVSTGLTRDPRSETVVYFGKGYEPDARRIAAVIPGAKVEKLTWKPDADVVVACVAARAQDGGMR